MIKDPLPENLHDIVIKSAQIQTQSICNGSCIICPYPDTKTFLPQGRMDFDFYTPIFAQYIHAKELSDPKQVDSAQYSCHIV